MTNPFAGFQWKHYAEMIGAAAAIGVLTMLSDELSKCASWWCHALAPTTVAMISGVILWLRGVQTPNPAPFTGEDRRQPPPEPPQP